ncbi:hypothetical protein OEB99_01865 [Actinotalea sp. M2MS4P-6]|uniref:hypothetical protein n=1 Tax=Actinotalea sp. M2MS4P-6 TaxID=2983762 RepID=UPI0021E45309|nr:hypothetical protein [Actinotalea sp. M2MS4P-6]MCV2393043.1 hypothetical protein [Actinotalea sp. M2MS4P-6]
MAIGLAVIGLLVAAASVQTFVGADRALARADANAAQLVRLQDVQTSLVRADADVTNAFLVGGLEPAELRTDYDEAISTAARQVTFAAEAQPADATVLADLATQIQSYTGTVELARANNRQALPVGAQYLKNASAGLRADSLPALAALIDANETRVDVELGNARNALWVSMAGALGLLALVAAMVWLARRTHRYLNLPMVAATTLLAVYLVVAITAMAGLSSAVRSAELGPYAAARALSEARIAAFDAKSNESLTLIARGSGAAFEEAWQTASGTATERLDEQAATDWTYGGTDPRDDWSAYVALHADIRAADDGGDWDQAVALATSREPGSANAAFAAFDETSTAALDQAGADVTAALDRPRGSTIVLALAGALVGLLVAALSWRGLGTRIEEYR